MPRYLVERSFPEGLNIPADGEGAEVCRAVVLNNAEDEVTWIHSYVSDDQKKTYFINYAPSPEAIRRTPRLPQHASQLPISKLHFKVESKNCQWSVVTEVRVLDPYFYR